jgi:hypothetical protein
VLAEVQGKAGAAMEAASAVASAVPRIDTLAE